MTDWIDDTVDWWEGWMDTAEKCTWDEYVGTLKEKLRAAHEAECQYKRDGFQNLKVAQNALSEQHGAEFAKLRVALAAARAACGEAAQRWEQILGGRCDVPHPPGSTCKDCELYHRLRTIADGKEAT